MTDSSLRPLDTPPPDQIVNVAKAMHRFPLRNPGGKTWLVPRIVHWLASAPERPKELVEPFFGGAIAGLTVAFEHLADHVILVELDPQVAALSQTIFDDGEGGAWLDRKGLDFVPTGENLERELAVPAEDMRIPAWQTLLRNRTNRGGILAKGAGKIKSGENDRGIASRWYPTPSPNASATR